MAKKIIWGEETCPGCKLAKNYLADEIRSGEFEFISVDSDEGQKIDEMFDFKEIPQCLVRKDGGGYEKCDLEHEIEESLKRKGRK
jgi:predicted DCC family thiol-disulfide oxidoreductase YuxK